MNITKGMLKKLIRESLSEGPDGLYPHDRDIARGKYKSDVYTGKSGMKTDKYVDAITTVLGVIGIADPTMISDIAAAIVYSSAGRHEEAMLTIALSAGGLGSGALAVKAGVSIEKSPK